MRAFNIDEIDTLPKFQTQPKKFPKIVCLDLYNLGRRISTRLP